MGNDKMASVEIFHTLQFAAGLRDDIMTFSVILFETIPWGLRTGR